MRILFIDDEPLRAKNLMKDNDVFFAHGSDQIQAYLSGYDFDLIMLDHDMPALSGTDVLSMFIDDIVMADLPVVIHSSNYPASCVMCSMLEDYQVNVKMIPVFTDNWEDEVLKFYRK